MKVGSRRLQSQRKILGHVEENLPVKGIGRDDERYETVLGF